MSLQLRESQRVALERLCEPGRHYAALWAEPRSGKTAVSLRWLQHIDPPIVVVVGPKVAEATWRAEASKWLEVPYRFYPLTTGNHYPDPQRFKGMTILFVNYEQFTGPAWKRLSPYLKKLAQAARGQGAMLLDESHEIKTPSSARGRSIRPLAAHWHYRLLITGTPVSNPSQIDAVYGQWTFLNPAIRNRWPGARDFREYFGEWTNHKGFPELVKPIRQFELNEYIQGDVITMVGPGEATPVRKVRYPVPKDVLSAHDDLLKHGIASYKDGVYVHDPKQKRTDTRVVAALNPLTRLLRMRTLLAGWLKDDDGEELLVPAASRARLAALGHVIRKRCKGKIVVAATHTTEIELVSAWLERKGYGYLTITGATKNKNHVIEQFQRDPEARVLLVQPRTVAMAVDISVANDLIWYTSDFNYITFKQASDRIKLSPASPTVWFLSGRASVDDDVWATLMEDHDHLGKVVDRIKRRHQRRSSPTKTRVRK